MYESYWRLDAKPFENSPDPRFFVPLEMHQGTLLKLRYAVENSRGAALLAGMSGLGKTLIIQALLGQLDDRFAPIVHVVFPQMPPDQLLAYIAESLTGVRSPDTAPTIDRSVRAIEQVLWQNSTSGHHAVLILDEAHDLEEMGVLETIRLLLNFEYNSQPPLTILLVGQPALLPAMNRIRELDERLAVKCLLRPLTRDETVLYVQHRLQAAGAQREIFQADAVEAVHRWTQGVPRRINRLCDLALLIGFAEERATIGPQQIESVAAELVATSPE